MSVSKDEQGKFVLYTDHVAALASQEQRRIVEAKIEILEEFLREIATHYTNRTMESDWAEAEIDRLRKEIA